MTALFFPSGGMNRTIAQAVRVPRAEVFADRSGRPHSRGLRASVALSGGPRLDHSFLRLSRGLRASAPSFLRARHSLASTTERARVLRTLCHLLHLKISLLWFPTTTKGSARVQEVFAQCESGFAEFANDHG